MKGMLFAVIVFVVSCSQRPLGQPCESGFDCTGGDWCVETWWIGHDVTAGGICASQCSSDADCEAGSCVAVGTGVTADVGMPSYQACRE